MLIRLTVVASPPQTISGESRDVGVRSFTMGGMQQAISGAFNGIPAVRAHAGATIPVDGIALQRAGTD
eukprot:SAG22_NODE_23_length_31399_cov_35.631313_4_plen_68_part_00